jgi:hypothetical protein
MGQVPLANNEIRDSIAIHIGNGGPVRLSKVNAPALPTAELPITVCGTKEMSPLAECFCSNQTIPDPCACKLVTTSFSPSPLTS